MFALPILEAYYRYGLLAWYDSWTAPLIVMDTGVVGQTGRRRNSIRLSGDAVFNLLAMHILQGAGPMHRTLAAEHAGVLCILPSAHVC